MSPHANCGFPGDFVVDRLLHIPHLLAIHPKRQMRSVSFHPQTKRTEIVIFPDRGEIGGLCALADPHVFAQQRCGRASPRKEFDLISRPALCQAKEDSAVDAKRRFHLHIEFEIAIFFVGEKQTALAVRPLLERDRSVLNCRQTKSFLLK